MNESNKLGKPTVSIESTEEMVCEKCGCPVFVDGVLFRKVPAILTGEGKPGLVPVQVFHCANCHHIPEDLIPIELQGKVSQLS